MKTTRLLILVMLLSNLAHAQIENKSKNISIDWMNQLEPSARGRALGSAIAVDMNGYVHTASLFSDSIEVALSKLDEEDEYSIKEPYQLKSFKSQDGLVCRYKPSGELLWATQIQATYIDAIDIDVRNNQTFIAGMFIGDLIYYVEGEERKLTAKGKKPNAFVLQLDEKGKTQWAVQFKGEGSKVDIEDFKVGSNNTLFVTGKFKGTSNFNTSKTWAEKKPIELTSDGLDKPTYDAFILKLDYTGKCLWVKAIASPSYAIIESITLDDNNIYVGGYFKGSIKFSEADTLSAVANTDAFVAKYDEEGNLIWVKKLGGIGDERVRSLAVNEKDELIIGGEFSTNADLEDVDEKDLFNKMKSNGSTDGFLLAFDTNGDLIWSQQLENQEDLTVSAIDIYSNGNILVTGNVRTKMSTISMYLFTFDNAGELMIESTVQQSGIKPKDAVVNNKGEAFVLGSFKSKMTIDQDYMVTKGMSDAFLIKIKQ